VFNLAHRISFTIADFIIIVWGFPRGIKKKEFVTRKFFAPRKENNEFSGVV
jgi:hypothetical protein